MKKEKRTLTHTHTQDSIAPVCIINKWIVNTKIYKMCNWRVAGYFGLQQDVKASSSCWSMNLTEMPRQQLATSWQPQGRPETIQWSQVAISILGFILYWDPTFKDPTLKVLESCWVNLVYSIASKLPYDFFCLVADRCSYPVFTRKMPTCLETFTNYLQSSSETQKWKKNRNIECLQR